jgi:hypothetical protein
MYLQKIISRKSYCFLLTSWRSRTKIAGSGAGSGFWAGSIGQRHGSGPEQNVKDPQHWYLSGAMLRMQITESESEPRLLLSWPLLYDGRTRFIWSLQPSPESFSKHVRSLIFLPWGWGALSVWHSWIFRRFWCKSWRRKISSIIDLGRK